MRVAGWVKAGRLRVRWLARLGLRRVPASNVDPAGIADVAPPALLAGRRRGLVPSPLAMAICKMMLMFMDTR